MKNRGAMKPLRALRNTLCSPKKYQAKSGTQKIRVFYLHMFLGSTGKILPVYV
jgi:hypothetical protein